MAVKLLKYFYKTFVSSTTINRKLPHIIMTIYLEQLGGGAHLFTWLHKARLFTLPRMSSASHLAASGLDEWC